MSDDTTGHVLHGDAAEDPVGGGRAPGLARPLATGEDDTQGHLRAAAAHEPAEDDTDGHLMRLQATEEPEDDTEGHLESL